MSKSFTKLFSSITESTVWCESHETVRVWITMLAMADHAGRVWASIPGLANRARVEVPECEKALRAFLSPDTYSRTKEHEGRRIAEMDGGWVLLNHAKYRALQDADEKREADAERQRKHYYLKKAAGSTGNTHKTSQDLAEPNGPHEASHNLAEAESDTDTSKDSATSWLTSSFEAFWKLWPKRVARKDAEKAWAKLKPNPQTCQRILAAVRRQSRSHEWVKDKGKFIPHPATWLNGRRWEDEGITTAEAPATDGIGEHRSDDVRY